MLFPFILLFIFIKTDVSLNVALDLTDLLNSEEGSHLIFYVELYHDEDDYCVVRTNNTKLDMYKGSANA